MGSTNFQNIVKNFPVGYLSQEMLFLYYQAKNKFKENLPL